MLTTEVPLPLEFTWQAEMVTPPLPPLQPVRDIWAEMALATLMVRVPESSVELSVMLDEPPEEMALGDAKTVETVASALGAVVALRKVRARATAATGKSLGKRERGIIQDLRACYL